MDSSCLSHPLNVIDNILESSTGLESVTSHFTSALQNEEDYQRVPMLTAETFASLPHSSLVRFRGMVQDVMDPEYFMSRYKVRAADGSIQDRMGFFRDHIQCEDEEEIFMDSDYSLNRPCERQSFFLFPIPGESLWVQEELQRQTRYNPEDPHDVIPSDTVSFHKEDVEDSLNNDTKSDHPKRMRFNENGSSRRRSKEAENTHWTVDSIRSPVPGDSRLPCIAKIYSGYQDLRLHNAVEVVGVLVRELQKVPKSSNEEDDMYDAAEAEVGCTRFNPPSSLVPRIHVVSFRKLHHLCPLLPQNLLQITPGLEHMWSNLPSVHTSLIDIFEHLFLGDRLLAQYLSFYMISSVYNRSPSLHSSSHVTLNIANVKSAFDMASKLEKIMSIMTSPVLRLPLSLAVLNIENPPFMPIKDVNSQRLLSGRLQLVSGSHLLVDESVLAAGQLQTRGCLNVRALKGVLEHQVLTADCQFHQAEVPVNVRALVLSEGRSFLKTGCLIPWEPAYFENEESIEIAYRQVLEKLETNNHLVEQLRKFFALCSVPGEVGGRPSSYTIPESLQKIIQDSFVESRKDGTPVEEKIEAEDLNFMLTMLRLSCSVTGRIDASPNEALWQQIRVLESERRKRKL